MAFIQPCRINLNTQEIKDKLLELNYDNGWFHLLQCKGIATSIDNNGKGKFYGIYDDYDISTSQYDCKENINLFLALTALKDNSDINQWVICTMEHIDPDNNILYKEGDWRLSHRKKMKKYKRQEVWRKATINELINKFN